MTEALISQDDEINQVDSNPEGVFDITSIETEVQDTFDSIDRVRLCQMGGEVREGGAIELSLERLVNVRALAQINLEKLKASFDPALERKNDCEKDIAEIVRRIGEAGVSISNTGSSESEIAVLSSNLISVNKQLAEASAEVAIFKSNEAKLISRIRQCEQAISDIEKYRAGCLEDLSIASKLNSSMSKKPGLHLLIPAALLSEAEQDSSAPNTYSHVLGRTAASVLVECPLPETAKSHPLHKSDNHTDPPRQIRESLSPAPLEIGARAKIFQRRNNKT